MLQDMSLSFPPALTRSSPEKAETFQHLRPRLAQLSHCNLYGTHIKWCYVTWPVLHCNDGDSWLTSHPQVQQKEKWSIKRKWQGKYTWQSDDNVAFGILVQAKKNQEETVPVNIIQFNLALSVCLLYAVDQMAGFVWLLMFFWPFARYPQQL